MKIPLVKGFKTKVSADLNVFYDDLGHRDKRLASQEQPPLINFDEVKGRNIIMIDDSVVGGGTISSTHNALKKLGIKSFSVFTLVNLNSENMPIEKAFNSFITDTSNNFDDFDQTVVSLFNVLYSTDYVITTHMLRTMAKMNMEKFKGFFRYMREDRLQRIIGAFKYYLCDQREKNVYLISLSKDNYKNKAWLDNDIYSSIKRFHAVLRGNVYDDQDIANYLISKLEAYIEKILNNSLYEVDIEELVATILNIKMFLAKNDL